MKENSSLKGESPADLIDAKIRELDDWRGSTLSRIRNFIKQVDPDVVEELKWRKPTNPAGVPVWSHDGLICTGETYKDHVKVTFAKGASLKDPSRLFNPASKATPAGPSMFMRARRLMKRHLRPSSERLWR
jgi:hypothetical protein